MNDWVQIIENTSKIATVAEKLSYFAKAMEDPLFSRYVELVYDPNIKFNISKKEFFEYVKALGNNQMGICKPDEFLIFLEKVAKAENKEARMPYIHALVTNYSYGPWKSLMEWVLDKGFKVGIGTHAIYKLLPKLDNFRIAGASSIELTEFIKRRIFDPTMGYYISRKLDGVRCITRIGKDTSGQTGDITFWSRNGKQYKTLERLAYNLYHAYHPTEVLYLDGEVCLMHDDEEDFRGIMQEIRRKDHTIDNPYYFIYDVMTEQEFRAGVGEMPWSERMKRWPVEHSARFEKLVHVEATEGKWNLMLEKMHLLNWEGLILRKDTGYKQGKGTHIFKYKEWKSDEFKVVGTINGEQAVAESGGGYHKEESLAALTIIYHGSEVSVGAGFTKEQRRAWYQHPEEIIGQTITVKWFEDTENKEGTTSMRFPQFVAVRDYE